MRTRTIYEALRRCESRQSEVEMVDGFGRITPMARVLVRQQGQFRNELFRRMDHYDWYEARQRYFDESDPLGDNNGENNAAMEDARHEMNAAYKRFAAHPRERARAAAWRKENGK